MECGNSECGSALIIVMFILVMLSIIGIDALKQSDIELQISRNDRVYKQNLFYAEGAVVFAGQRMENQDDPQDTLVAGAGAIDGLTKASDVNPGTVDWDDTNSAEATYPESRYAVSTRGIAVGNSMDMGATSNKFQYDIYGRSELKTGQANVVAGYLVRF